MVEPFKSRVSGNVVSLAQRIDGPGVVRGLEAIGGALGNAAAREEAVDARVEQAEYDLRAADEALNLGNELHDLRATFNERLAQAKAAPPEQIDGLTQSLTEDFQKASQAVAGKAGTRSGQDSVLRQAVAFQAGLRMESDEFVVGERVRRGVQAMATTRNNVVNSARSIPTGKAGDEQYGLAVIALREQLTPFAAAAGEARVNAAIDEARGGMVEQRALGALERDDFAGARALADGDEAKALWTPDSRDQMLRRIGAAEAAYQAGQRAQAAAQTRELKEQIGARRAELDTGAGTPADWDALARLEESVGNQSGAVTARAKGAEMAAVQGSRDLTLPEMDAEIATLTRARNGARGLTTAQASRLAGLTTQRSQSAARLNDSGGALAQYVYATGSALPPLNAADPASLRGRGSLATAAAIRYGRNVVEPITAAELPGFRDLASGTPTQRLEAADQIQGFGDARAIAGAARQMTGGDDGQFRIAALVRSREVRRDILRGDAALAGNKAVWSEAQAQRDFAAWYGRTLDFAGPGYRNDIFAAARAFYAQRASEGGETKYNPGRFAEAIEAVAGRANGTTGGTIRTNGGSGALVLIPQGVPRAGFLDRFSGADADDYARASGGRVPVWGDGRTVLTRRQLIDATPTMVGDGLYGFRGADGKLLGARGGGPYVVDYRQLTAR